ncbi:hypothetical protein [Vreelandella alkaliphila]|uniref:hypothetical protein n=1 Tax=Vreelandella alkaliphila TaxID=272774 RepID=UPI003FD71363
MKLQLTALAAAMSLAVSGATFATDLTDLSDSITDTRALSPTAGLVTIDTEQDGNSNTATVTQAAGSTNTESRVYQNSDGSDAFVDQSGNNLYSDVDQQISDDGLADVDQTGANHRSRIEQNGSADSSATVSQQGGFLGGNAAYIRQANVGGAGSDNSATISQVGSGNDSGIRQQSSNNIASSLQVGGANESLIVQRAGSGTGHNADVQQYVLGNTSQIQQGPGGTSSNHEADVLQVGFFNDSFIEQTGTANFTADVTQLGTLNESTVLQYGAASTGTATVLQNGFGNQAFSYQY